MKNCKESFQAKESKKVKTLRLEMGWYVCRIARGQRG